MREPNGNLVPKNKIATLFFSICMAYFLLLAYVGYFQKWLYAIQFFNFLRFASTIVTSCYAFMPIFVLGYFTGTKCFAGFLKLPLLYKMLVSWALGWAIVVVIGMLLLTCGLYSPFVWIGGALTINLLFLFWLLNKRWEPFLFFRRQIVPKMREYVLGFLSGPSWIWNIFILVLLSAAFLHALLPPNSRDALAYHLVLPRLWEFQHDFYIPHDNFHLMFPGNIELMWGYALAVGGVHLPCLLTFSFGLMTVVWMWKFLKDQGYGHWVTVFSLLFFLITPLIILSIAYNDVEWPLLFFLFLGLWGAKEYIEKKDRLYIIIAGRLLGGLCGFEIHGHPHHWSVSP